MNTDALPAELAELNVPHVDEYFGVWAILEDPFRTAVEHVGRLDLRAHVQAVQTVQSQQVQAGEPKLAWAYELDADGVAVIDVTGPLMKYVSSLSGGTSTVFVRKVLRAAVQDERVRAILLRIDSPGGTVAGTNDLAEDVARAAASKPVQAYIEDTGASAAYWIASAAAKIYAGPTAMVGSIGTFAVIHDLSGCAAREGIKVHVIRAGVFKGAGQPGTEITAEQLAEWQRIVDELNEHFLRAVARGRRMTLTQVRELADGRVQIGSEAAKLGLIDGIQTFGQTLMDLRSAGRRRSKSPNQETLNTENETMEETVETTESMAQDETLTVARLKQAFPGSDAAFREQCLEKGLTYGQARDAWIARLEARNESQNEEIEKLSAAAKRPGVEPLKSGPSEAADAAAGFDDAVGEFNKRVRERMTAGLGRSAAVLAVARADPALHQAYLEAVNPKRPKVQGLIAERFELEAAR